jgi:exosortase A
MSAADGWRGRSAWSLPTACFLAAVLVLLLSHLDTVGAMVTTWRVSATFAHGFIVYPVALWLAWRDRHRLAVLRPAPQPQALVVLTLLMGAWFFADLIDVQLVRQAAVVASVPVLVWLCFGGAVAQAMWFPLAFTAFAVPFGEGLVPHLMQFTADFTVGALNLVGIPVYREGMLFSTSSGDFEVAKACSGIRYLIASLALGTLYAYLTYRSWWRRGLFIMAALLVPVIANGLRAFGIVMIAHFSEMHLAVGIDHLIYGWLFFGLVIFLLFWVGGMFREDEVDASASVAPESGRRTTAGPAQPHGAVPVTGLALVVIALAPLAGNALRSAGDVVMAPPALAVAATGWTGPGAPVLPWIPAFAGADDILRARYQRVSDGAPVEVAVAIYRGGNPDGELVNGANRLTTSTAWTGVVRRQLAIGLPDGGRGAHAAGEVDGAATYALGRQAGSVPARVLERELVNPLNGRHRFWSWYLVGGGTAAGDLAAKWRQAGQVLSGHANAPTAFLAVATPDGDSDDARAVRSLLAQFVLLHGAALAECATASEEAETCRTKP